MGDNNNNNLYFQGLPPPSAPPIPIPIPIPTTTTNNEPSLFPIPQPPLKSALKRSKLNQPPQPPPTTTQVPPPALKSALKQSTTTQPQPTNTTTQVLPVAAPERKRARFKTTTDASETQVIEAMQKIASHIKNLPKFSKASKLAIQLIQAGSVKAGTSDYFFTVLESAMSSTTACNEPSVRADYHALFSAAQDAVEFFDKKQSNQLRTWAIRAVLANDLFTDDSFVFSKAAGKIKEAITNLPVASKEEDIDEAVALEDDTVVTELENQIKADSSVSTSNVDGNANLDPFGLDDLVPSASRKEERAKRRKEATDKFKEEENETKKFLRTQREALIACLEISARRYKTPWCQTSVDILVKHAFDNISKFTSKQRDAIGKLWASIREQQSRRKQGKSVSGKLDVNGFEWLQEKYSNEKISIRHAVGGSGERRCTQWLG